MTAASRMTGRSAASSCSTSAATLFAEKGFEATSVEEIAARADVSKPVVYEHFGGKEGLYAVVVDREIQALLDGITGALTPAGTPARLLEQAALALLDYIENNPTASASSCATRPSGRRPGRSPASSATSPRQVEHILAGEFKRARLDPKTAPIYAQMLVGMVALTGQWWLDARKPKKDDVAAHLVNLAWNGLSGMEAPSVAHPRHRVAAPDPGPAARIRPDASLCVSP